MGWWLIKNSRALKGHKCELLRRILIFTPSLKGSVLEALMWRVIVFGDVSTTSWKQRVVSGLNDLTCVDVYSDTRRNP